MVLGVATALTLSLAAAIAGCEPQAMADEAGLNQQMQQIADGRLPLDKRIRTVEQVLQAGSRDSLKQLIRLLAPDGDLDAHRAIVPALRRTDEATLGRFDRALLGLLDTTDELLLRDVTASLGRLEKKTKSVTRIAMDPTGTDRARRGAILALTHHHSREAAGTMIRLLGPEHPVKVRLAAFEGLRQLTGNFDLPDDAQLWHAWWKRHGSLGRHAWQAMLLKNFAGRTEQLTNLLSKLESRLIASLRNEYLGQTQDERTALLVRWLDDPVPATQLLAMDLIEQRLIDVQASAISEDLRAAIRVHLDDPMAAMRQRSAEALRDLRDEQAARLVTRRLRSGSEQHVEVLRAYLKLLRHVPHRDAVEPAMRLLSDPRLNGEAADVLAEAAGTGADDGRNWLDGAQVAKARRVVRRRVRSSERPHASMIRLLGRLATSESVEDWNLIAGYLDSDSDTVKNAAARAWAESGQSLDPLTHRAHDPVIQPFLFDAIAQRGSKASTMMRLIAHRPDAGSLHQAWQQAVLAMAGRVDAKTVVQADRRLAKDRQNGDLRERFLDMAIGKHVPGGIEPNGAGANGGESSDPPVPLKPVMIDMLLRRAELYLDKGKPQLAMATYQRLSLEEADRLTAVQLDRCDIGRFRSDLALGEVAKAIDQAATLLKRFPEADDARPVVVQLLEAAERSIEADQHGVALQILQLFAANPDRDLSATTRQRLDRLRAQLEQAEAPKDTVPPDQDAPVEAIDTESDPGASEAEVAVEQ